MATRELVKDITINDELYRVRKMNVLDGVYLAKFVTEKIMPMLSNAEKVFGLDGTSKRKKAVSDEEIMMKAMSSIIPGMLADIKRDELDEIIQICLNACDKVLPAGAQPIMSGKNYGIQDVQYDTGLCLKLCYHCIVFNLGDFFGEGGLDLSSLLLNISK